MARYPLVLPDTLMEEINSHCTQSAKLKSKLLVKWVREGFARDVLGEGPAEPPAAPTGHVLLPPEAAALLTPAPALTSVTVQGLKPPETIRRGDTQWFSLADVCVTLDVPSDHLLGEIDPDDDVLKYAGKEWIAKLGLTTACTLAANPARADALRAWAEPLIN